MEQSGIGPMAGIRPSSGGAGVRPKLVPNEFSVLRLLTAILMETSDEWKTGRA